MTENYKVYVHITPNNKLYIGITKADYLCNRFGSNGNGYKRNIYFWRAIQKYGWDNIQHIILIENLSKEMACECEKYLIAKYKSNDSNIGYNLTDGGEGMNGYKLTDDQRKRASECMKGHPVSEETRKKIGDANRIALKGKHLSEKTKQKLSEKMMGKNKGRKISPEHIERLKQINRGNSYHLGFTVSEESRKRMSDAHKGLPLTDAQKANLAKLHAEHRGKPRSEETKQKIRESHIGKKRGPWSDAERKAHMESIERRKQAKLQNKNT